MREDQEALSYSPRGKLLTTSINETRKIDTPLDQVWEIVSDVNRDPDYWSGLTSIKNTRKEENLVEREVVVGFLGRKGRQRIMLNPKESIELTLTSGPLRGSRTIRLTPLGARSTKVEVSWNIEFSEVPVFAHGFVKSRLEQITREALEKIAKAAESS